MKRMLLGTTITLLFAILICGQSKEKDILLDSYDKLSLSINSKHGLPIENLIEWKYFLSFYYSKLNENKFYGADSVAIELYYINSKPKYICFIIYEPKFSFSSVQIPYDEYIFNDGRFQGILGLFIQPFYIAEMPLVYKDIDKLFSASLVIHIFKDTIVDCAYNVIYDESRGLFTYPTLVYITTNKSKHRKVEFRALPESTCSFITSDREVVNTLR